MRSLVEIISGSHAYGTAIEGSDIDIRMVHIPDPTDIVLQRISGSTRLSDDDRESSPLHKFIQMATEGHPIAIEMLFSPSDLILSKSDEWNMLVKERGRILTNASNFASYARGQAKKYAKMTERMNAAHTMIEVLDGLISSQGSKTKLGAVSHQLIKLVPSAQLTGNLADNGVDRFIEHGGRKVRHTESLEFARSVFVHGLEGYGNRSQAAKAMGVDWKSLALALKIAEEGVEYHRDMHVTLPRPEAATLRDIRAGRIPIDDVLEIIAHAINRCAVAEKNSQWTESYDREWADDFVAEKYGQAVANAYAVPLITGGP